MDDKGSTETPTTIATQTSLLGETASNETSTTAHADAGDPRGERNRTWSVEVRMRDGSTERDTVKAVDRAQTFRTVFPEGRPAQIVVDGVTAYMEFAAEDVRAIRVSKG